MSDRTSSKQPRRKAKATNVAAEPPRNIARERTKLLARVLEEPRIQKVIARITNDWNKTPLEDEAGRLEYIRVAYEELVAEFIPRIAVAALEERYGMEAVKKTLGDEVKGAVERWRKAIAEQQKSVEDRYQDARIIDQEAAQNVIIATLDRTDITLDSTTSFTWDADTPRIVPIPTITTRIASQTAFSTVDKELEHGGSILEVAKRLLLIASDHTGKLVVGTGSYSMALARGLLSPIEQPRDHNITDLRGGHRINRTLRTGVEVYHRDREEILEKMFRRFQEINHDNGAGLLKLHTDLMNQAWETGGDLPVFRYEFAPALERQGYSKNDERRSFHNESMRHFRELFGLLRSHYVKSRVETAKGRREEVITAPFWIVELFHSTDQEAIEFIQHEQDAETADIVPVVLRENAPLYTAVTIRPGLWWTDARMSDYHLETHPDVLKLPTNNESGRIALLAAIYLASHIRRNQNEHAGKTIPLKVGTLLEGASIMTKDAFLALNPNSAKRLRTYLDDLEDDGALPLLRRMGAADVSIADESEYMFTGRGWKERFWEARLLVAIPSLGIERIKRSGNQVPRSKRKKTP